MVFFTLAIFLSANCELCLEMPPRVIAVSVFTHTLKNVGWWGCRVNILTALVLTDSLVIVRDKFLVTYGNAHITL